MMIETDSNSRILTPKDKDPQICRNQLIDMRQRILI